MQQDELITTIGGFSFYYTGWDTKNKCHRFCAYNGIFSVKGKNVDLIKECERMYNKFYANLTEVTKKAWYDLLGADNKYITL